MIYVGCAEFEEMLPEIETYIRKSKSHKKRGKSKVSYKDCILTFDIETSKIPTGGTRLNGDPEYRSFMYVWQMCLDAEYTFYGRTWEEFKDILIKISLCCGRSYIVCFVHNLSYEFSFLRGIFLYNNNNAFFTEKRKPLYCRSLSVEFRCSYKLFNMSLGKSLIAEEVPAEYQKSEMDYDIVRYPDTPLTDDELVYCRNDVLGLALAIKHRNETYQDTPATMPYTSTGYIRREVKKRTHDLKSLFSDCVPTPEVYRLLRTAFRGGNTHANREFSGAVVYDVHTVDIASSYPYALVCRNYPLTPWKQEDITKPETIKKLINDERHAVLMRVVFRDLDCGEYPIPYISDCKCNYIEPDRTHRKLDNGRLLSADLVDISITELDYKIIVKQYKPKSIEFKEVYTSIYKPLPAAVTEYVKELYYKKCTLKKTDPYMYARSKELLNSCYGMSAQDILHPEIVFDGKNYTIGRQPATPDNLKHGSLNNALPYQIGVWCTAHARMQLEKGFEYVIKKGGKIIYTDTDSIKYIGNVDFADFNSAIVKKSYTVNYDGRNYVLGVYEMEETADKFKTLGAKKYVALYGDELKITIAGVPKKEGAKELKEAGGIDEFEPGFIFRAGKMEAVYNDDPGTYIYDGRTIEILSDVTLYPTTYEVGITADYALLLSSSLTNLKVYDILKMQMEFCAEHKHKKERKKEK